MDKKVIIEGKIADVTLSNLGLLEEYDIANEDINEETEIKSIMEEIDAYTQGEELDVMRDVCTYRVMNSEDIEYLALFDEESGEREVSVDTFKLVNKSMDEISGLLEYASVGDVIYLRKEAGKANITLALECEENDVMSFCYFDCSVDMNEYDLLRESYYDTLCDTFLPETLSTKDKEAVIDNFLFEPQIIYGELYRIVLNGAGVKSFQKIELPRYYFQDTQKGIDEE